MHPNAKLIQSFYESFKNLDPEEMKKCYHPKVQFSDPVFPHLTGEQVSAMWAMLISNLKKGSNPWQLDFNQINATDLKGSCHWEAHYTLSVTGRKVHNIIDAQFHFQDGLIIQHSDTFNFYRWARLGFGIIGTLMGWHPLFKRKVQARVRHQLEQFLERHKQ